MGEEGKYSDGEVVCAEEAAPAVWILLRCAACLRGRAFCGRVCRVGIGVDGECSSQRVRDEMLMG